MLATLNESGNVVWLRLYASLSPQLRTLLTGQSNRPGGINGHMLTSQQWSLAQALFDRIGSERGDAVFSMSMEVNSREQTECHFIATDRETGKKYRQWTATLPRYLPPEAEKKADS